jgi:hypothetical protein
LVVVGIIALETIIEVKKNGTVTEGGEFEIICAKRVYNLKAEDSEEANGWIRDIKSVLMSMSPSFKTLKTSVDDLDTLSPTTSPKSSSQNILSPVEVSHAPFESECIKAGWMQKQKPSSNSWQRRFFK